MSEYWQDKQAFLKTFVSKKPISRESEHLGLDKDSQSLKDIQIFWE